MQTDVQHCAAQSQASYSSMQPPVNLDILLGHKSNKVRDILIITSAAFGTLIVILCLIVSAVFCRRRYLAHADHSEVRHQFSVSCEGACLRNACACAPLHHNHTMQRSVHAEMACSCVSQNLQAFALVLKLRQGMQNLASTEMTGTTGTSYKLRRKQSGASAEAHVYCNADAPRSAHVTPPTPPHHATLSAAQRQHGATGGFANALPETDCLSATLSSIALDDISDDGNHGSDAAHAFPATHHTVSQNSKSQHFARSASCVDVSGFDLTHQHSHAASGTALGGLTARERVVILSAGTNVTPRGGVTDTSLEELSQRLQAEQRAHSSQSLRHGASTAQSYIPASRAVR